MTRDPYDGQPFYCLVCGGDYTELDACTESECRLESVESALLRQRRRKSISSDLEKFQPKE